MSSEPGRPPSPASVDVANGAAGPASSQPPPSIAQRGGGGGIGDVDASTSDAVASGVPGSAHGTGPPVDSWEAFMDDSSPPPRPAPAPPRSGASGLPPSPGAFFSGLLHKVSTSFDHAKREIGRRDLLAQAQESLTELRGVLPYQGGSPSATGAAARPMSGPQRTSGASRGEKSGKYLRSLVDPSTTRELKSLRLNTTNGQEPLFAAINEDTRDLIVVTERTIEAFDAIHRRKILESRIHAVDCSSPESPALPHPPTGSNSETTGEAEIATAAEAARAGRPAGASREGVHEASRRGAEVTPPKEESVEGEALPNTHRETVGKEEMVTEAVATGAAVRDARSNLPVNDFGHVGELSSPGPAPREARPLAVMCAGYLGATQEVIVGCRDGSLCLFSVKSGQMGGFVRRSYAVPDSLDMPSAIVSLVVMPEKPSRVAVGCQDGSLFLVETSGLSVVKRFPVPEMCCSPVGSGLPDMPVSCLYACISQIPPESQTRPETQGHLLVAYQEGVVSAAGRDLKDVPVAYVAQSGDVKGLAGFFENSLIVSIGNDSDPSISVAEAVSGRCLARRMLPYTPTAISTVKRMCRSPASKRSPCCPSDNTFIVGGNEGQVEVFRVSFLSPCPRVELTLIRSISENHRKSREVRYLFYDNPDLVIFATSINGEVRMWKLGAADAQALCLPHTAESCTFNEENITESLRSDFKLEEPRLSASEDIIAAQKVLASVLEEEVGITEAAKDALVSDFQRQQAEMQDSAMRAGKVFMRTRRRVQGRYARGMALSCQEDVLSSSSTGIYVSATRKSAALELEFAHTMYVDHLTVIRKLTMENLQVTLLDSLLGAVGDTSKIEALRTAAVLLADV
jgi:hypothetical protein